MPLRTLDPEDSADKKIIDALDKAFQSWLIAHKMMSRGGVIYKSDKLDDNGNPTAKVDPEDFVKLLTASLGGFAETVRDLNPLLHLTLERQNES